MVFDVDGVAAGVIKIWTYSIQNIDGSSGIHHNGIDIKRTKAVENVDDI